MFQSFGVEVLGLDLSENMVNIALDRAVSEKLPSVSLTSLTHLARFKPTVQDVCSLQCASLQVQFEVADATRRTFPQGSFDVIYSRDTILHIDDKLDLFKRFHVRLFSHCLLHFILVRYL